MRPMPLLATGFLAAALLTVTAPSYAAGETCQGRPATVVGAFGQLELLGTEGDDVVVTNGSASVRTGGGNDVVCVTGGPAPGLATSVTAGAGDDVVDASAASGPTHADLGAGSDAYYGSPFSDDVFGGGLNDAAVRVDTERDTISTGAGGDDSVTSGSDPAVPNSDVVALGADDGVGFGSGVSWIGPLGDGGSLDGGGNGRLSVRVGSGSVALDTAAGALTQDGRTTLAWTGFDRFYLYALDQAPSFFAFLGSDRDEELGIRFSDSHTDRQRIDMAGGDDTLLLGDDKNLGARGSRYIGGPGRDHAALWGGSRLDLDLKLERIKTVHKGRTIRSTFTGFETQLVGARKVVFKGTNTSDEIRFYACKATIHGRAGKDDVAQDRGDDYFEAGRCSKRAFRIQGNGGNDTLRGSTGSDVLLGGPGRDTINGNGGRDRCSGEKLRSCEIKLR